MGRKPDKITIDLLKNPIKFIKKTFSPEKIILFIVNTPLLNEVKQANEARPL